MPTLLGPCKALRLLTGLVESTNLSIRVLGNITKGELILC